MTPRRGLAAALAVLVTLIGAELTAADDPTPPAPPPPPLVADTAVVLPVGAGEAVSLPGAPRLWRQTAGPAVTPTELEGATTWRLFAAGTYRFETAPDATPVSAIQGGAWQVFAGKNPQLGDRRPQVNLPAMADAQAGHPLQVVALRPHDDDQDPLSFRFRVLKTVPADLVCRLYTRDTVDRCVLEAAAPGQVTIECRVFDGRLFSHPALMQVSVGGSSNPPTPAATPAADFTQPVTLAAVDLPFDQCMDRVSAHSRIPIVFQSDFGDKHRPLTLRVTDLPLLRLLDLVAWQTGAQYRLELLSGDGAAPDRTAVVWISGWAELRREPLVAGELSLTDFAARPDGSDIAAPVADILREALAAVPTARCNLHGADADLGVAVYLPRSAHDRLLKVLQALQRPLLPTAADTTAAELRAAQLALELMEIDFACADLPVWQLLPELQRVTGRQWLVNPRDLADRQPDPTTGLLIDSAPRACPVSLRASQEPAAAVVRELLTRINARRAADLPTASTSGALQPVCWTPHCWLLTADAPLPELNDRRPGPGQWLWQSAEVRAYDLSSLLAAERTTGLAIEHAIRTRFAAEFRDPAAHLSWWPRKKALLVIARPAVQTAIADTLANLPSDELSELHPAANR